MTIIRILFHLLRADFLERTRRYSFLVMLGAVIFLGFLVNNGSVGVMLGKYRGEYNTAWVGAMMSLVATFFLSWFGFYLVKNTIQRDERTGVGQIIATTPLGKLMYVTGKAMSNFAVLAIMVVILILAAVILQFFSHEVPGFPVWDLVSPFLLITLPVLALVASLAVLFESIPLLSGGMGNVLFFFGWAFVLVGGVEVGNDLFDVPAMHIISESMKEAARAAYPDYTGGFVLGSSGEKIVGTFRWNGILWTRGMVLVRLAWLFVAPLIVVFASLFFRRFDTTRERRVSRPERKTIDDVHEELPPAPGRSILDLTPVVLRFHFGRLVIAELNLLLKGMHWWWYAIAMGLIVASVVAPLNEARQIVLPIAWMWPLLVWSSMGTREERFRTHELVFSSPRSLQRQFPSVYAAGVLVALIAGCGIGARLLIAGDWPGVAMWCAGAFFVPSFALASGVWSGSNKLFEILYLAVWYIGPMNKIPELDFIGAAGVTRLPALPLVYLLLAAALFLSARWGRRITLR